MAGQGNKERGKTTRERSPAFLEKVDIVSQEDKTRSVSVIGGTVRVLYWESLLADSVRATVTFTDAGNTLSTQKRGQGHGKRKKKVSAVEGLPIIGKEKVNLKFTDNHKNTIDFNIRNDNNLIMNSIVIIPTDSETSNKTYMLDLASPEFIANDEERVKTCLEGPIEEMVKTILKDNLKTDRDIEDLEKTKTPTTFSYTANNKKPFYTINKLSKKAISEENQKLGVTAGYFFWETSDGYKFKSIDTLLSGKQKISILYNETPDSTDKGLPAGYDVKALTLEMNNKINVQQKLAAGTYSTRLFSFNPWDTNYDVPISDMMSAEGLEKIKEESLKLAGERLPVLSNNDELGGKGYTKSIFQLAATGQINIGEIGEQLDKSKLSSYDYKDISNQANMRYNQLFASEVVVTIPGDFSLHAGDTVFIDLPETGETENKSCADEVNNEDSGLYLISDLCHYITAKETYTKLNLIRDSFGRVVTPS